MLYLPIYGERFTADVCRNLLTSFAVYAGDRLAGSRGWWSATERNDWPLLHVEHSGGLTTGIAVLRLPVYMDVVRLTGDLISDCTELQLLAPRYFAHSIVFCTSPLIVHARIE